jgi:hypothetical protein
MDTGRVSFSIISIFLLAVAGLFVTKQFLFTGNSYYPEMDKKNKGPFLLAQVFLPFLAGNAILIMLRQPRFIFYDTFIGLTMILCILPVLVTFPTYNELYFEEEEKKPGLAWFPLLALAVLVFVFRVILEFGLRFRG